MVDRGWRVVVVGPGAQETGAAGEGGVPGGARDEALFQLPLGHRGGQVEGSLQPQRLGDGGEEVIHLVDACCGEHGTDVLLAGGKVAHSMMSSVFAFGDVLRVGLGIHETRQLGRVGEGHLDDPSLAVGIVVQNFRMILEFLVDRGHGT